MKASEPASLPAGWAADPTPPEVLKRNREARRPPSARQAAYLFHRCRERGVTTWDLVRFGVELQRIAPITDLPASGPEAPYGNAVSTLLTGPEAGGLFEIVAR